LILQLQLFGILQLTPTVSGQGGQTLFGENLALFYLAQSAKKFFSLPTLDLITWVGKSHSRSTMAPLAATILQHSAIT